MAGHGRERKIPPSECEVANEIGAGCPGDRVQVIEQALGGTERMAGIELRAVCGQRLASRVILPLTLGPGESKKNIERMGRVR